MLKEYVCHKKVKAAKILVCDWIEFQLCVGSPEQFKWITLGCEYFVKHQPAVGGYLVEYEDGYRSFSPAKAFEDGYTLL